MSGDDSAGDLDRLVKSAYGAFLRFRSNLAPGYELSIQHEEAIILDALNQHGAHLHTHQVEQRSVDAFKLVCWIGGSLLSRIDAIETHQREEIIDALIRTLEEFLILETNDVLTLPDATRALLKSLLLQEQCGNGKHGIWMNGLYMSFHCCVACWRHNQSRG